MHFVAPWLLFFGPASFDAAPPPVPPSTALALIHATVIDTTGGPSQPERTLLIFHRKISQIGKTGEVAIPAGAQVIDASGKYLIPGLWDMHVHLAGKDYLTLFVANGVTGIREMHAFSPDQVFQWRKATEEGKVLGPHIVAAGALVDGARPFWPGSVVATNAAQGREAVNSLKKRGADFIKVYTKLPRDAYLAIADEAKKQGLPFAGHVPESVRAAEASVVGQKSMEHLYGLALGCSSNEDALRKEIVEVIAHGDNPTVLQALRRSQVKGLDSYDPKKAAELFAEFVRNGTWQTPTLTVLRSLATLREPAHEQDPRLKYMPRFIRGMWNPKSGELAKRWTPEMVADMKRIYDKDLTLVRSMHQAGVPFLAGTDTTNPYCYPGFSLHDELQLLVDCGFSPLEALQTATLKPAKFLGRLDSQGTVEKGKAADLVLLDGDPLHDIGNTRKIAAVIRGGQYLDRSMLDQMLSSVAATNK